MASALAVSMLVPLAGCVDPSDSTGGTSSGMEQPGEDDKPFGITTRPENDFEKDPNRHDRQPVQKTLTLKGGAKFADDSTSKVLYSGTTLKVGEDIKLDIPDGKILCGWLADDTEDPSLYGEYYSGADFVTLRKDASIQPVFDVPSDAYAPSAVDEEVGPEFGKVGGFAWEQRTGDPQTSQDAFICKDTLTQLTVGGELGSYFHVMGGTIETANPENQVPAGWHTMFLSKYEVVDTQTYGMTYTIQNFGDEAIDVQIFQTNSSGNVMPSATASAPVHLEPGEVDYAFTTFGGWTNGNVLCSLKLLNAVDELKVGLCSYIMDYEDAEEYEIEVTEGFIAATEGNVTSATVKAGMPVSLTYENTDDEKLFLGWQNVDDPKETYPNNFTMPNKAIKLQPWLEAKTEHMHTVTLGENLTFASGGNTKQLCWTDELDLSEIRYSGEVKPGHKIFFNVFDGKSTTEKTNTELYTMPDSDVTIEFARTEVVWSATNGKVGLPPFASDAGSNAHKWRYGEQQSQMVSVDGDLSIKGAYAVDYTVDPTASIGDIDGEECAVFHLVGYDFENDQIADTISPDDRFMMQINHNIVKGAYTDTATIKNFGDEAITIQLHYTRSSSNYKQNASSDLITINPGEVKTVSYTVNFDANNTSEMITIQYKGAEAISDMTVGLYIYRSPQA